MWARAGVATKQCPKSLITAESLAYLHLFQIWKTLGAGWDWNQMDARTVEAMLVLEAEFRKEMHRGE